MTAGLGGRGSRRRPSLLLSLQGYQRAWAATDLLAGLTLLFQRPSMRQLVVTGGTGLYGEAYGYADIRLAWTIAIHYGLLPSL